MSCIYRGAVLYSLPVQYEKQMVEYEQNGVERKFPYCDYYFRPTSDWNYGFVKSPFKVEKHEFTDAFSENGAPVTIKTKGVKLPWREEYGVAAPAPDSLDPIGEVEDITLVPYGCTILRMTEMPFVETAK